MHMDTDVDIGLNRVNPDTDVDIGSNPSIYPYLG